MKDEEFFDRFKRVLNRTKETYDLENLHDALIVWHAENVLFLDPEEVIERIVYDKRAEGVDAFIIDENSSKLIFIQAKTVENFNNTRNNLPENDIKNTLEGVRFLIRGEYKGRITSELENLIDEYHDKERTGNYKTQILFLTLKQGPVDSKFIENFEKEFENVEVEIIGFNELKDFYENVYLVRLSESPKKVSFQVKTNILKKDEPYKSRVFTIKAGEIARVYSEHKEKIFQQNVRYFLGIRSKSINEQIYRTASSENGALDFWYFNNGITMICKEITVTPSEKVVNLEYPQIINGAQTTYALYRAYEEGKLNDNAEVLIRVIETNDKNLIEAITLYTNSQNAIRLRDLCSNDKIQIRIQKIIESYRYFYERKRGEFDANYPTPEQKRKLLGENYKEKLISNEKAAQAFLAFYLDKPAQAKSEKKRIFVKDESGFYKDIFDEKDEILPEKLLLAWKLLKYIEKQKQLFRKKYRNIDEVSDEEREKMYRVDFILHSEYFILNLFKDFLRNKGYDVEGNRNDIVKLIEIIESEENPRLIREIYVQIVKTLADYIEKLREQQPDYYHNKFFKNEKNIGLVRNFFRESYGFVKVF